MPTRRHIPRRRSARTAHRTTLLALLAAPFLCSCQPVPTDSRRDQAPRVPDAPPQRVSCMVQAVDSDSSGHPDTILVIAYLFPASNVSPFPVWSEGEFRFTLKGEDEGQLAQWIFPSDQVTPRRGQDGIGPNHTFTLDIKAAAGTDRFPPQMASFSATFIRPDGVTASTAGTVAVRLGSTR